MYPKTRRQCISWKGICPPALCVAWGALCLPFLTAGVISIRHLMQQRRKSVLLLAMSGAFIFVISSLKIPSVTGSCSHMTGTGLAAILFGVPAASVLGVIVLVFQAVLLAHGGLTTLGANTFSMAVAGPLLAWGIYQAGKKLGLPKLPVVFAAAMLGDLLSFGPMNLELDEKEVRRRVEKALESLGLMAYRRRGPQYLSGGEKRRVAIADILAMEPRIMLLDEPSSNLDPAGRRLLEEVLQSLHEDGMTLVVATHDVDFAWRWADRILVFHGGKLERDASPEEVFQDQALLDRCGLEQPLLWQVARGLNVPAPHDPAEFAAYRLGGK